MMRQQVDHHLRRARAAARSTWRVSGREGSSQNQPSLVNIASVTMDLDDVESIDLEMVHS